MSPYKCLIDELEKESHVPYKSHGDKAIESRSYFRAPQLQLSLVSI